MRLVSLELLERLVSLARPVKQVLLDLPVKPESLELQAKLESQARPVKLVSLELLERPA